MTRTLDVRVDVIRDGVKYTTLSPSDTPSITMNADGEIKTSLTGTFVDNQDVDWLSDELQPVAIIDGTEYHLGVFLPSTVTYNREEDHRTVSVEAYDRCWQVQCSKTETVLHLAAGTNYLVAVEQLLTAAGISLIRKTPTSLKLTADREDWDIGTDYLTVVNQLLDEINYNQLWFDNDGYAILEQDKMLKVNNAVRTYDSNSTKSMMLTSATTTMDLFSIPNVFVCICSNPDNDEVMKATATNTNFASPYSIARRGKRIMEVYSLDNIASQEELQTYADILCKESMFTGAIAEIQTAIIPGCGVNDVVSLIHPDADGMCVETEWTISLCTGGTMSHVLHQQPRASIKAQPKPEPTPTVGDTIAGIAIAGLNIVGKYGESEPLGYATALTPSGSEIAENTAITYTWSYSITTGTEPTASELQYSSDGTTWNSLATVSTAALSYTDSSGLSAGDYSWRVRSYNQSGVAGPWSDAKSFSVTEAQNPLIFENGTFYAGDGVSLIGTTGSLTVDTNIEVTMPAEISTVYVSNNSLIDMSGYAYINFTVTEISAYTASLVLSTSRTGGNLGYVDVSSAGTYQIAIPSTTDLFYIITGMGYNTTDPHITISKIWLS